MSELRDARVPPHDLDAEAAVISSVLVDPAALDKVQVLLRPEAFYSEAHRRIFEACLDLSASGKPTDVVQVSTWLRDRDRLAQVGGMAYMTEVLNAAPAVVNVEAYAATVAAKAQLRSMLLVCQRIVATAYAPVADVAEFVEGAEQSVYEVARSSNARPRLTPMLGAVQAEFQRWAEYNRRIESGELKPGQITGVPTGLYRLDDATTGLQEGELTIVAARPGMGKSAMAVEIVKAVGDIEGNRPADSEAPESGEPFRPYAAALFSLEMPKAQIAQRVICSSADVDIRKARMGLFDRSDWGRLTSAVQRLRTTDQFYIDDTPALSITQVRAMSRDLDVEIRRTGRRLRLIVVDYLQLAEGSPRAETREQAVASISRALKAMAKELNVAVVALSQLNRSVEQRADKRPLMSDLRESGSLEQDADNVIFIYRDDYYNDESTEPGVAELIVAKQRNGPTGTVKVGFDAKRTRFYNLPEEP